MKKIRIETGKNTVRDIKSVLICTCIQWQCNLNFRAFVLLRGHLQRTIMQPDDVSR